MAATVNVDGYKVAELRVRAGYDQSTAAELIGVSRVGLWKIETKGRTSPATLRRVALLLGVDTEELIAKQAVA